MFFDGSVWRAVLVCGILGTLTTCSRKPERTPERIAIVAFENLTGDPALTWTGVAIANIAAAQATAQERIQTFEVRTLRESALRLATQTIEGYLTRAGGQFTVKAVTRDTQTLKTKEAWTASAPDVMTLAAEVASRTGVPVTPYVTSSGAAAEAYFRGITAADLTDAEAAFREAIRLDPQYGAPVLALHDLLAQTNRTEEAQSLIASLRNARLTPVEKARYAVLTAEGPRQQIEALFGLARLRPGDLDMWRQAAERATNQRLYKQAVDAFNEVLRLNPGDEIALNSRGYAHVYAGDFEAASAAFEEYRKALPDSVNAIDSTAEMMFYFRRYAEAARLFMEAHERNPSTLGGVEPFRAAWSQYLAGNLPEADRLVGIFLNNPTDPRQAIWRRWTGRQPDNAPPELQSLWQLQDGQRSAAAELAAKARKEARDPAAANLAGIASVLSMPSAPPGQWRTRVQQAVPAPQQQAVRDQLFGWALYLDGHAREAADHWRTLLDRAPGQIDNEPRVLLAASLLASGQEAEARKVMPHGFMPPQNLARSLDVLLHPIAANVVKKLH